MIVKDHMFLCNQSNSFIETIVSTVQTHIIYIPCNKNAIKKFTNANKKSTVFMVHTVYWLCMCSRV